MMAGPGAGSILSLSSLWISRWLSWRPLLSEMSITPSTVNSASVLMKWTETDMARSSKTVRSLSCMDTCMDLSSDVRLQDGLARLLDPETVVTCECPWSRPWDPVSLLTYTVFLRVSSLCLAFIYLQGDGILPDDFTGYQSHSFGLNSCWKADRIIITFSSLTIIIILLSYGQVKYTRFIGNSKYLISINQFDQWSHIGWSNF